MKFFFSIMLSCTLLSSPFYEEQPLIQPASADLSESFYQMSVAKGEVAELSARQLEIRLGLEEGELLGITITALPDNGSLVLDGARISEFSQLTREELDRLCFVPEENALCSGFSFIPNCPSPVSYTHLLSHRKFIVIREPQTGQYVVPTKTCKMLKWY